MTTYPNAPAAAPTPASHQTANAIRDRAKQLRRKVFTLLISESLTTHEVAARLGETVPAVQPRVSELKADGRIEETGEERINKISGKPASVYRRRTTPKAPQPPKKGTKAWWQAEARRLSAENERLRQQQEANARRKADQSADQLNLLEATR